MTATTRRIEAALRDLEQIRRETEWLARHLGDIEVIAHTSPHGRSDRVFVDAMFNSPDLSQQWQPELRENIRITLLLLKRTAVALTAARVGLESHYGGPGPDQDLGGTLLDPGELDDARRAKGRRDANQGDYRWGEWEATPRA